MGWLEFDSREGQGYFSFVISAIPTPKTNQISCPVSFKEYFPESESKANNSTPCCGGLECVELYIQASFI